MDEITPIKELLKRAGISQKEICARTGINQSTLSRWINENRKVPMTAYVQIYNECDREILRKGDNVHEKKRFRQNKHQN